MGDKRESVFLPLLFALVFLHDAEHLHTDVIFHRMTHNQHTRWMHSSALSVFHPKPSYVYLFVCERGREYKHSCNCVAMQGSLWSVDIVKRPHVYHMQWIIKQHGCGCNGNGFVFVFFLSIFLDEWFPSGSEPLESAIPMVGRSVCECMRESASWVCADVSELSCCSLFLSLCVHVWMCVWGCVRLCLCVCVVVYCKWIM